MARHEVYIANYYFKRGAFVASSERAKYMLEMYPGAPSTEDALLVLIGSYNKLGSKDLALESAKVLVTNFSDYSYEIDKDNLIYVKNKKDLELPEEDSFFNFGLF